MKSFRSLPLQVFVAICLVAAWQRIPSFESKQSPLEQGKAAYYGVLATPVALALLQPLAAKGNAEAQYYMGLMHDNPDEMSLEPSPIHNVTGFPNYEKAARWYRLSAEQGFFLAQAELGRMYYDGRGVPKDAVQADMWLGLATSSPLGSVASGKVHRANFHAFVESQLTPAQIAEAHRRIDEWRAQHR